MGRHGGPGLRRLLPPVLRHDRQPRPDVAGPRQPTSSAHMIYRYAAKDYGSTTPPDRWQPAAQPGLRVRCGELDRHLRPDHQQHRSPGPRRHWKAWLRWQRLDLDRDDQPERRDPVDGDGRDAVVLAADRHVRDGQHGLRHDARSRWSTVRRRRRWRRTPTSGRNATYAQKSFNVTAYKGKTITVKFLMNEDSSLQTSFVVDDTALATS